MQKIYDIYIAAPFFNVEQVKIVNKIEDMCVLRGLACYSPRLHSGSHELTPEQRKDFNAWKPILQSNIDAVEESRVLLAVVEYAMPSDWHLCAVQWATQSEKDYNHSGLRMEPKELKTLELPDNGVVFECGYAYKSDVPIVGFHRTKHPDELNLMLSHTMLGLVTGFRSLEMFLRNWERYDWSADNFGCHPDYRAWATPNSEVI